MDKESVNGLLVSGIGSTQRSNSVDSFSVESPTRKGFGLNKWRRIKRDGPVEDEAAPVDDGSRLLKRGLTGLVNPPCKHVDLSSVEARQSSEGSVNMVVHPPRTVVASGFSSHPGFVFTIGQGFEKSEEHSGNSIAAKNVGGRKIVLGSQGKDDTKPCSNMDSDMRSSDFVFSSEAVSANHIEEGQAREQVQTYSRSENGGKDEDGDESKKKKNHYWAEKDHIEDSIRSLAALQEALWKEVKSFQEVGKVWNIDEVNSRPQVLNLKQKVKHLQHKLEETRADLDAKEAKIQELENSKIESAFESVFQRKIEAEIEHLLLTRSLHSSLQVLKEQPKKVHSLTEDPEPNRGNILGKTCKSTFYFLTQLILLVSILRLLFLQSSPASRLVIPT